MHLIELTWLLNNLHDTQILSWNKYQVPETSRDADQSQPSVVSWRHAYGPLPLADRRTGATNGYVSHVITTRVMDGELQPASVAKMFPTLPLPSPRTLLTFDSLFSKIRRGEITKPKPCPREITAFREKSPSASHANIQPVCAFSSFIFSLNGKPTPGIKLTGRLD